MAYSLQFDVISEQADKLLAGAWLTIWLSAAAMIIGLFTAIIGALARTSGPKPIQWLIAAYVELIRNTPFLVQIYFIFFGLPTLGLRLSPNTAALTAMVVNVSAYAIEILRAGIESVGRGQVEAGTALGLSRLQVFRYVILLPALRTVYPALTSQFVLLMLTSSVVSAISANDLTSAANEISSQTFRPFEAYVSVTAIYFLMVLGFSAVFDLAARRVFSYPMNR